MQKQQSLVTVKEDEESIEERKARYRDEMETLSHRLTPEQLLCAKLLARHSIYPQDVKDIYNKVSEWLDQYEFRRYIELERRTVVSLDVDSVKIQLYGLMRDIYDVIAYKVARGELYELPFQSVMAILSKLWEHFQIFNALSSDRKDSKSPLAVVFQNIQMMQEQKPEQADPNKIIDYSGRDYVLGENDN